MLLPSALPCDSSQPAQPSKSRFTALFASPPLSPPASSFTGLYSTCRALQSMLSPSPQPAQLPTPPMAHAEVPTRSPHGHKLRLRALKPSAMEESSSGSTRRRITKRAQPTPRGINKRRRSTDDEMTRENDSEEESRGSRRRSASTTNAPGPSTPKRLRLAPEVLPLGLERSDFHTLHLQNIESAAVNGGDGDTPLVDSIETDDTSNRQGMEEWSTEEDRLLVELVLEKLRLTKSEWQDCARSLGRDRGSVGRRWRTLMGHGEVGLKNRSRRTRLHNTWR
ncbi:hypothetical protein F5884DRAFT_171945 [Xylogone sp. PMI_703]|nr:hypothetical protein F5884DRAFT_171945 [Xylogone sp. PMI_703]